MRGMHRLLAAILLAGAVGGLVVFARHLGRVPEPVAVRLSAPPPQHLTAPGAVHAPLLVTARPTAALRASATAVRPFRHAPAAPLTLSAASPLTVPRVTTPTRHAGAPVSKPKPPATRTPPPAPPQEQVRVLADVPLTPVAATTPVSTPSAPISSSPAKPGNGKAHAYGHLKQPKAGKSPSVPAQPPATIPAPPQPPAPVVQPAPAVELTPVDPGSADAADADQVVHGHGWGRGNGKGHRG
jgi:hypothetical protein